EDGIRDLIVTGVQTCALPISAHESARLTWTISVERRLGRMWRRMMRAGRAPIARAASTKSRALSASTGPRTTRARIGVYTTAMRSEERRVGKEGRDGCWTGSA